MNQQHILLDSDWVFVLKIAKALKMKKYGDPYSAIANLAAHGEPM